MCASNPNNRVSGIYILIVFFVGVFLSISSRNLYVLRRMPKGILVFVFLIYTLSAREFILFKAFELSCELRYLLCL